MLYLWTIPYFVSISMARSIIKSFEEEERMVKVYCQQACIVWSGEETESGRPFAFLICLFFPEVARAWRSSLYIFSFV
jgi:hypothetical protein